MLGPVAAWITALTRGTMAGWNQVLSQPVWQLVPLMSSSDSGRCRRHCHPGRWDGWHHWMTHITLYFYRFHFGSLSFQARWSLRALISFACPVPDPALSVHELGGGVNEKTSLVSQGDSEKGEKIWRTKIAPSREVLLRDFLFFSLTACTHTVMAGDNS